MSKNLLNKQVWYFKYPSNELISNNRYPDLKVSYVRSIAGESCYHNSFIHEYTLDNGDKITSNDYIFDNEDDAIDTYNTLLDEFIKKEYDKVEEIAKRMRTLESKKITFNL